MLLFFDLSGLGWMIYNFFMISGAGAILLVAIIVGLVTKGNNHRPFTLQRAFGFVKGALFPFIGGILGMCAHPDFFERPTRRALDNFVPFYVSVLAVVMIIIIIRHFKKLGSQQGTSGPAQD